MVYCQCTVCRLSRVICASHRATARDRRALVESWACRVWCRVFLKGSGEVFLIKLFVRLIFA